MSRKRKKKQWKDLSSGERAGIIAAGTIQVGLQLAALWDIRRRPHEQIKGRKGVWAAATFVNTLGPLAYFKFGRRPTHA
jgi:hypothetical protein